MFRKLTFILFLCLFLASCSTGPVSPIGDFPLAKGNSWTYSVIEYQPSQSDPTQTISARSEYVDTVVDTQTAGDFFIAHVVRAVRRLQSDPAWIDTPGSGVPEWWYVVEDLKVYESRQPLDVNHIKTDLLLLDLDFPLDLGKAWCSTTGALKGGSVGNCLDFAKVSVEELKTVASKAVKARNCVQLTYWSNGGNEIRQFCPRVGFVNVKFDHSGSRFGAEQTLIKFSR